MYMQFAAAFMALLACVVVPFQYARPEAFVASEVSDTACVALPISMFGSGCDTVRILVLCQSFIPSRVPTLTFPPSGLKFRVGAQLFVNLAKIIVNRMSRLKTYFRHTRVIFRQSFIPGRFLTRLCSTAVRVMASDVFRIYFLPIDITGRSRGHLATSAFTRFRLIHNAIHCTGKLQARQDKSRELLENPYGTISSQANQEWLEGSETNAYGPERAMKRHERGSRKARYSPNYMVTCRTNDLNVVRVTKLNSIPWTGKLEALSEFNVNDPVQHVLRQDMAEVLDKACGLEFKKTARKYVCLTTATGTMESRADGNTFATSNIAKVSPSVYHIQECVDWLRDKNIAPYDGEDYVGIFSVNALREIYDDGAFQDAAKYGDPERLFAGEVGRIYNCRCIRETNYLVNTLGSSSGTNALGEGLIFGAETVMEGIAVPEELRQKIPTDYGRSKGLAWYGIMGWEKMWKSDDSGQNDHIIHITSTK